MRFTVITLLALILVGPVPTGAQDVFLTNGRILDPTTETVRTDNLLILGGRIAGRPNAPPPSFRGETVDLGGRWVIPGLHDLHTHSYGNMALGNVREDPGSAITAQRLLYAGVTGFLDLFAAEDEILGLRDRLRADPQVSADVFAAGPCLTRTDGHCTEYETPTRTIDSPEEARQVVTELAAKQPDVVKVVYGSAGVNKSTLASAVATATAHEIPTVIHVETVQDMRDAIEAGASALTHVPRGEVVPEDVARRMAERGVFSIPTAVVRLDFGQLVTHPDLLDRPLARAMTTAAVINAYRRETVDQDERARRWVEEDLVERETTLQSLRVLADAGVPLLIGTDAGNLGVIQGFSVHREMELFVAAGLSPWEALRASTTRAGELLGRSWGFAEGDEGSVVVLEASPLDDITNTQRIWAVVHHGTRVDREELIRSAGPTN